MRTARTTRRLAEAAAVLLATCALALTSGAQGKGGGKGGGGGGGGGSPPGVPEIAYVTSNSLYVMNADGSGQTRLLRNSGQGSVRAPCWSPDGTQIAFQALIDGISGLWVIRSDGSGLREVHRMFDQDLLTRLDWSPVVTQDGSERIVFNDRNPATGEVDIFVVDPDGSRLRPLTDAASSGGAFEWVCWTWNAAGIVRTNGFGRLELMQLGLDGAGELVVIGEILLYEGALIFANPEGAHLNDWIVVSEHVWGGTGYYNAVVLDISDPFDVVVLSVIDTGLSHLGAGFSPDDSELVYYRAAGSTSGVFRVGVFSGPETQILDKGYEPDCRGL